MEDIITLARKVAEQAEVFLVTSEEVPVRFEANRLKHIQAKQSRGVALRIIKNGKLGYAFTTKLDSSRELVDMAVETAQFGMAARFELPSVNNYPRVDVFDPDVESVPIENMIKIGEELISKVTAHTPELICDAGVAKVKVSVHLMNSRGGEAIYQKSVFGFGLEGSLIRGTDMLFVGDRESSCHPLLNPEIVISEVIRQLELAKNQASVPTRPLPVVFTSHGVASSLVTPLMAAFNGKTVLEGASPLVDKLGESFFSKKLSVWDDSTIAYEPQSRPCDDEGIPSQRTPLITDGVVTNFFYDLQTAGLAGTKSTGNADRGPGGLPSPSPSAFVIVPGDTTFNDMVSDMKQGLVIEQLMGAEQGNILGGDFSGNVLLGYKVENGKIKGRVKNTMVFGNVYELLKNVAAIGSETRWIGGFVQTPPIYCPSLSVAAK